MNHNRNCLLNVRHVSKSFYRGEVQICAVRDVSFSVGDGEFIFLCGPSGSGKSTLLTMLGCLLKPDVGEILFKGDDLAQLTESERTDVRRNSIGFVFQRFNLILGLTALQNVTLPLRLRGGCSEKKMDRRGRDLLEQVGLEPQIHAHPTSMSVGQCQRVAIARALATKPKIVLADEPTASLDSISGIQSIELLKKITRDQGASCIVVTHDPRILPFADRKIELEDGRVVSPDTSDKKVHAAQLDSLRMIKADLGQEHSYRDTLGVWI